MRFKGEHLVMKFLNTSQSKLRIQQTRYTEQKGSTGISVCSLLKGPIDSLFLSNAIATAQSDLRVYEDNVVLIPDNEPRNVEVIKQIEKYINENFDVVI